MKRFYKKDKNKLFDRLNKVIYRKDKKVETYSIIKQLKKHGRLDNNTLYFIDSISLEDLMSVKLELSFKSLKSRLINYNFLHNLKELVEKTCLQYAMSISTTYTEVVYMMMYTSPTILFNKLKVYGIEMDEEPVKNE